MATEVRLDKAVPDDLLCREIGTVYGNGDGGELTSNEDKMANAQTELRNRAAYMGANFVVMDFSARDKDTFTLSGRALSCQKRPKDPLTVGPPNPNGTGAATGAVTAIAPEQRLRTLQDLHDKGLVDDAEYQQRRKAILDSL